MRRSGLADAELAMSSAEGINAVLRKSISNPARSDELRGQIGPSSDVCDCRFAVQLQHQTPTGRPNAQ